MAAPKPVRKMRFNHFKVFSGNANHALAAEICYELGCQLAAANVKQFSDGEIHLQIQENVRGADVFVVQPTYGYARQDRKDRPRMPISARLVASVLESGSGPHSGAGLARRSDPGLF